MWHRLKPVPIQTQSLALRVLRALVNENRKKRKPQPIGMLGRSSSNHDWLLANASACVFCGFSFTQRTQRRRLRLNVNRASVVYPPTGSTPITYLRSITCEVVVDEMMLLTTLVMMTVRVMRGSATEFNWCPDTVITVPPLKCTDKKMKMYKSIFSLL